MLKLLENIYSHSLNTPQKIAIVDQEGNRETSYAELVAMSGRLATWLLKQGIGKEKIVAIRVPRGVRFVASRLAAMMIGAAWVGVEDMMGEERITYIIKDSGADLIIDDPDTGKSA
ncbi:MAG: AMP-binding protein [Butyrivibrio sp.]|nr:AMP-binding protein [Butyrivibrio sp.]